MELQDSSSLELKSELTLYSVPSTRGFFLGTLNPPLVASLIKYELSLATLGIPLFVRKKLAYRSSLLCTLQLRQSITNIVLGVGICSRLRVPDDRHFLFQKLRLLK